MNQSPSTTTTPVIIDINNNIVAYIWKTWAGSSRTMKNLYQRPPLTYMIVAFIASFFGIALVVSIIV
jgi:hypothetical protein